MDSNLLHVVTALYNPARFNTRMKLFRNFRDHMLDSGVNLTVVECATGDMPHEANIVSDRFTDDTEARPAEQLARYNHITVRAKNTPWIKENLIRIGMERLPNNWKYVAWFDADIEFRRKDWAPATLYALQHYDVVQPWSDCYDLGPNEEHVQHHKSFCERVHSSPETVGVQGPYTFAHPGYAWAATRSAIERVGGLLDIPALGANDHHMALSMVGKAKYSLPGGIHPNYAYEVHAWGERAMQHINHNIGYVPGTIEHFWHGRKADRKYISRWEILTKHQFDPYKDVKRNTFGVYELTGSKPMLRRDVDHYFRQRAEDGNLL